MLIHTSASPLSASRQHEEQYSLTLPKDDRQLVYTAYGDPAGVPVVFLHGTPGSRRLGALLDEVARETGVRLLALDRPGFGRSSPWPQRSLDDSGEFVTAVLDDAGIDRAGMVAFSGGSPHALATAESYSDRVARVDIIAGATPPEFSRETPMTQRLLSLLAVTAPVVLGGLLRAQARLAPHLPPSFIVDQYTTSSREQPIPDDVSSVVKTDFIEALGRHRSGAITEFQLLATEWGIAYERIDAPVCLWHGEADTNVPLEDVQRFSEEFSPAELRVLDDADHLGALIECTADVLMTHG